MNKYGLLGRKLGHSYSKIIHEFLFKKNNIDATYELIEIEEDMLKTYINYLYDGTYNGYNVTIPYKEKVMPYLDSLTDAARKIGAVNTIYVKDGLLVGDNTDYIGLVKEINSYGLDVEGEEIYILGTGGASKAARFALEMLGAKPVLVSRDSTKGITYDELAQVPSYSGIINTTPVGMWPNVDESPISKEIAERSKFCLDLIFNPKQTKFMSYNKKSYNGLLMLIYQAIEAEYRWNNDVLFDLNEIINEIK